MSTKVIKNFEFSYPLTNKVVRNLRIVNEHAGDLLVRGTATKTGAAIDVDIDSIKWNGAEVLDLLQVCDLKGCSILDEVHGAAFVYCHDEVFTHELNLAI